MPEENKHKPARSTIRARPRPKCLLCGTTGEPLYQGLSDRLFGAPGIWNVSRCPDPTCGLLWLDPMPLEEDIGHAYANYHTHDADVEDLGRSDGLVRRLKHLVRSGYLARRYGYGGPSVGALRKTAGLLAYLRPTSRYYVDRGIMYLPAAGQGRLLDIGFGAGARLKLLRGLGWQVEGIDTDAVVVAAAREDGLAVRQGDILDQVFPSDHFDAVTMFGVIEHVHDPLAVLNECHRILKPGGRVSLLTPNSAGWSHRLYGKDWRGLEPPRHLQIFNLATLTRAALKVGFRNIHADTIAPINPYVFQESRALRDSGRCGVRQKETHLTRAWVTGAAVVERVLRSFRPELGDEARLIARK